MLGTRNLAEILSERETISHTMQTSLDEATEPWGVKVERVEMWVYASQSFNRRFENRPRSVKTIGGDESSNRDRFRFSRKIDGRNESQRSKEK